MSAFDDLLRQVLEHRLTLSRADARHALELMLVGEPEVKVAALIGALASRGETTDEIAGFVDALRASATPIPLSDGERDRLVDTCGTGGDGSGTFNISTGAALVAAAAGAWVAKHGNRAVTSSSGSADVLEALGIPVDLTPEQAAHALRTHGFAFLSAPALQPAMRAVLPLRRALGIRTIFNILGPMTNPAGARAQVIGVYSPRLVRMVAPVLAALGTRSAFVVHGAGMDEFTLAGPTLVGQVLDGEAQYGSLTPADLCLPFAPVEALAGGDAQINAAILREIFAGKDGPARDIVVLNAAAVLITADLVDDFAEGIRLAQETIDGGKVSRLVIRLAAG